MISIKQENTTVNLELAEKQGLNDSDILKIGELHLQVNDIVDLMLRIEEKSEYKDWELDFLKGLLHNWRKIQNELQVLWKFKQSSKYFKEYELPHCKCPKMDNDEMFGVTSMRYINGNCPLHGGLK